MDNKFPNGLVYTGFTGENWTKKGNRFVYTGELKPGESINYTLQFNTVKGGKQVPSVVAGSNLTSNDTAKARSSNVTNVLVPEITVKKVSDKKTVKVGDLVTFTITVTNTGDCKLGNVFVVDEIPDGLEFISFSGNGWSKSGDKYTYDGSLNPGESITLTIMCKALEAGSVTNVAVAGSNLTGNVSDSAVVEITEEKTPDSHNDTKPHNDDTPTPIHKDDKKPIKAVINDKATGNPILMLILVILVLIPLRRRKQ